MSEGRGVFRHVNRLTMALMICIGAAPAGVQAKFAPDTDWETVHTAHFRVHYPPAYRRFTAYLTDYLEEAYGVLSQDLHWELKAPADIVVRGDTDVANGYASVFPINRLVVHAVPFTPGTSIGEYDNWIRTLAYHELTHLVANDTTVGFFSAGRTLFGSAAKMNPYQPQWLVEGLAVYEETVRSIYGRGRSAFVDMVLRAAASEGLLDNPDDFLGVTLDRLNDGVPVWPAGQTPYFYGYVMYEMIAAVSGGAAPGDLSRLSGGRLPFFLNGAAEKSIGQDYYHLWDAAVSRMKEIANSDLAAIRAQPVTAFRPLTEVGRGSSGAVPWPDGSAIYFIRDSYREGVGISSLDPGTRAQKRVSEWQYGGGTRLRMAPDANWLLYSRFQPYQEYKLFSDVYLWDVGHRSEVRVTEGLRASEPDCSPDFSWNPNSGSRGSIREGEIAYIKSLGDGNQAIAVWNGSVERILYRGERFERLGAPAWGRGPAAGWIAFSFKVNGSNERLLAVNAKTGAVYPVTHHASPALRINELTPSWTADGALLYASSLGGVYNIYRLDWKQLEPALAAGAKARLGTPVRLTHFETGALSPVEWPGHPLLAMVYGPRGFDVAEVTPAPRTAKPVALRPLHEKLHPQGPPTAQSPSEDDLSVDWPDPKEDHPEGTPADYSAFPALWPKYWLPWGQKVTDGWSLGLTTSGNDALETHAYSILAAWDSRAHFPVYDLVYRYDGLYPGIQGELRQENKYLGLFRTSNTVDTTGLSLFYPIDLWSVSFGATVTRSKFFDQVASSGGVQARLQNTDVRIYPDSIDQDAGEKGHRGDVTFTGFFAGQEQFSSIEARWEQRIPLFWDRHYLRFFASGARSTNDDITALYYVGGGESNVVDVDSYLIRGYPSGEIFGRTISTLNLEYWMPFKDVFRGRGTLPAFYERAKLKFFVDTGSAEFVNGEERKFKAWPVGVGVHVLQDVKLLYRMPLTIALGLDWGLQDRFGGEKQIVFGIFGRMR